MRQVVDFGHVSTAFGHVSTAGPEPSPVAQTLAGTRANEARGSLDPADTTTWVHRVPAEPR